MFPALDLANPNDPVPFRACLLVPLHERFVTHDKGYYVTKPQEASAGPQNPNVSSSPRASALCGPGQIV